MTKYDHFHIEHFTRNDSLQMQLMNEKRQLILLGSFRSCITMFFYRKCGLIINFSNICISFRKEDIYLAETMEVCDAFRGRRCCRRHEKEWCQAQEMGVRWNAWRKILNKRDSLDKGSILAAGSIIGACTRKA